MQRLSLPSRAVVTSTLPRTARGLADEQLEAVVPGAPGAADFHPDDADRLELSRGFDTANVDWVGPAEVHQHIGHTAFGGLVISSDRHRWLALAEPRLDEVGVADRVKRLDHFGVGQRALDAFTERILARGRELGRKAAGEVEWVHGVDDDEVVRAGVGTRLLRGIAQHR